MARSVQEELTELAAQLQPLDTVAVALAIEASAEDVVPCACRLVEVEPIVEPVESNKPALQESTEPVTAQPKAPDPLDAPVVPPTPQVLPPIVESVRAPKKLVKSIFDLDYDEDEDPIHKFAVQAAVVPPPPPQPDVKPIENANKKTVIDQPVDVVAVALSPPESLTPALPRFRIIEDPACLAAEYYVTQKQDVCEEHLTALHNAYVPNVNGNWDTASAAALEIEPTADADGNEIEPDLYERIVPTYNHMCTDRIPKNLAHITFSPEQRDYKRRAEPEEAVAAETNLRLYDGLDQHKTEDAVANAPLIDPYVLNDDYDAAYEYDDVAHEPDIGDPVLDDLDDYDVPLAAYEPMSMDFDVPAVDLFPSAPTQQWRTSSPPPPVTFIPTPPPPQPLSRRSSSKVKYKIRKCSTDRNAEPQSTTSENSCATVPDGSSTKIIIKLSRQLTVDCSEEDEDDDDEEDDEDDDEEDDYDDEEDEEDEEDDEDEDEDELIAVPDTLVPTLENPVALLETCTPQCDEDDVANNNDETIGDAKAPFIDVLDDVHEEIVTTTLADRSESVTSADVAIVDATQSTEATDRSAYERLTATNYGQLPSFDNLTDVNRNGRTADGARFREWHEVVRVRSYNDELLTILPYVVID